MRMAGARTDKLWREAPQSLNLNVGRARTIVPETEVARKAKPHPAVRGTIPYLEFRYTLLVPTLQRVHF